MDRPVCSALLLRACSVIRIHHKSRLCILDRLFSLKNDALLFLIGVEASLFWLGKGVRTCVMLRCDMPGQSHVSAIFPCENIIYLVYKCILLIRYTLHDPEPKSTRESLKSTSNWPAVSLFCSPTQGGNSWQKKTNYLCGKETNSLVFEEKRSKYYFLALCMLQLMEVKREIRLGVSDPEKK